MREVVIAGAARTPIGSFNGSLSTVSAVDLGVVSVKEALKKGIATLCIGGGMGTAVVVER